MNVNAGAGGASLRQRLSERIRADGPLPFADYMETCLYDPELGYYRRPRSPFGTGGDFVTAPTLGELFARGLARGLMPAIEALGADWSLLELGPGDGALAAGLLAELEAAHRAPMSYRLLDTSPALRELQQQRLEGTGLSTPLEWVGEPPAAPWHGIVLANEVLDALPVERFRRSADGVARLGVSIDDGGDLQTTELTPHRALRDAVAAIEAALGQRLPVGYESEVCLQLPDFVRDVTAGLETGAAVWIDYGYPRAEYYHPQRDRGTLVAHSGHRADFDPLVEPGERDLSAFVDFTALAEAGERTGLDLLGFTPQAHFLLAAGIEDLVAHSDPGEQLARSAEAKQLLLPGEMGEKFKVMAMGRGLDIDWAAFELVDHRYRL